MILLSPCRYCKENGEQHFTVCKEPVFCKNLLTAFGIIFLNSVSYWQIISTFFLLSNSGLKWKAQTRVSLILEWVETYLGFSLSVIYGGHFLCAFLADVLGMTPVLGWGFGIFSPLLMYLCAGSNFYASVWLMVALTGRAGEWPMEETCWTKAYDLGLKLS